MDELTRPIVASDEYVHMPYGDKSWRENWWLAFFDNTSGIHGVFYNGIQPGLGVGHVLLAVFRGDHLLHLTDAPVISVEVGDHQRARTGPIAHECIIPMQRWRVSAETEDMRIDVEFDALAPAYDWGWSEITRSRHYEQSGRVVGEVRFGGTVTAIDGFGQRDRAWGHRADTGLNYAWSSRVIFGPDLIQHASLIRLGDTPYLFGYRIDGSGAALIDRIEIEPRYAYRGGPPLHTDLHITAAGRTIDQVVRLQSVIPRSYGKAQLETRQFFTFSEWTEGTSSGLGQLDLWWSSPYEEVTNAVVSGNNGRWVEA